MVVRTGCAHNSAHFVRVPPGCHEDVAGTTADPSPYMGYLALTLRRPRLVQVVVQEVDLSGFVCMRVCVSASMHHQELEEVRGCLVYY